MEPRHPSLELMSVAWCRLPCEHHNDRRGCLDLPHRYDVQRRDDPCHLRWNRNRGCGCRIRRARRIDSSVREQSCSPMVEGDPETDTV